MSEKRQVGQRPELFFPYYINQSRLLDIYAILNGGYSEFSEITTSVSLEKSKTARGEGKVSAGFKILDIGGGLSGDIGRIDGQETGSREKKVQTVTSILSHVLKALQENKYIDEFESVKVGSFVVFPAVFKINSIKSLMDEVVALMNLISSMQKSGIVYEGDIKEIKEISSQLKSMQPMFAGEEIFFDFEEYAIVGNIQEENLYQAVRDDLIDTELFCLAQVKRIFPHGTELMRNTVFKKLKDPISKRNFIKALQGFSKSDVYKFEATVITEVVDRPVYQIEVIALYQ